MVRRHHLKFSCLLSSLLGAALITQPPEASYGATPHYSTPVGAVADVDRSGLGRITDNVLRCYDFCAGLYSPQSPSDVYQCTRNSVETYCRSLPPAEAEQCDRAMTALTTLLLTEAIWNGLFPAPKMEKFSFPTH